MKTIRLFVKCACVLAPMLAHASASGHVDFFGTARITGTSVLLGDVANLAVLPEAWRDRAKQIVVATLPACCETRAYPVADLARVARLKMPGITPWLQAATIDTNSVAIERKDFTRESTEPASHVTQSCMRVRRPVNAGAALLPDDIEASASPCQDSHVRRVAYSHDTHVVRAVQSLVAGDHVTAFPLTALARMRRGEVRTERVSIGNVTVTRELIAPRDEAIGRTSVVVSSRTEQS